jgi:hypothetical protein
LPYYHIEISYSIHEYFWWIQNHPSNLEHRIYSIRNHQKTHAYGISKE